MSLSKKTPKKPKNNPNNISENYEQGLLQLGCTSEEKKKMMKEEHLSRMGGSLWTKTSTENIEKNIRLDLVIKMLLKASQY